MYCLFIPVHKGFKIFNYIHKLFTVQRWKKTLVFQFGEYDWNLVIIFSTFVVFQYFTRIIPKIIRVGFKKLLYKTQDMVRYFTPFTE